jgi:hypothetical protein
MSTGSEPKQQECPCCFGSGYWYAECCNGAWSCSCKGQSVFMGDCQVCLGTGFIREGANILANAESIWGISYLGSGPTR